MYPYTNQNIDVLCPVQRKLHVRLKLVLVVLDWDLSMVFEEIDKTVT